jgi:hypothetical protein
MRRALLRDLNQFVHNVLWRGPIRVTHSEINDVDAIRSLFGFEFIDDIEDVGRQSFDALEFFHP